MPCSSCEVSGFQDNQLRDNWKKLAMNNSKAATRLLRSLKSFEDDPERNGTFVRGNKSHCIYVVPCRSDINSGEPGFVCEMNTSSCKVQLVGYIDLNKNPKAELVIIFWQNLEVTAEKILNI